MAKNNNDDKSNNRKEKSGPSKSGKEKSERSESGKTNRQESSVSGKPGSGKATGDDKFDIEHILKNWPFDPFSVNVRLLKIATHEFLQMRVDMGILQLEIEGRPDGKRPDGASSYYDLLKNKARENSSFELKDDDRIEIDREFVQYYHRRVCWLQLKEFGRAVADADHTLGLMDFCKQFSPNEEWTITHEQYRPFVMYHRTQAAALDVLETGNEQSAVDAIAEVDKGLAKLRALFVKYDAEDQYEEDELVMRLIEFRKGLNERFDVVDPLQSQLNEAIASENYELAAQLRDQIEAGDNQLENDVAKRNDDAEIDASDAADFMLDELDELDLDIDEEDELK